MRGFLLSQPPKTTFLAGSDKVIARFRQFKAEMPASLAAPHSDSADFGFHDLIRPVAGYVAS